MALIIRIMLEARRRVSVFLILLLSPSRRFSVMSWHLVIIYLYIYIFFSQYAMACQRAWEPESQSDPTSGEGVGLQARGFPRQAGALIIIIIKTQSILCLGPIKEF